MAWIGLAAMAGGALLNAQGQKQTAAAQAQQQTMQAQQDTDSANLIQDSGYQSARRMREQGTNTEGQATAALAASGVDVNSETAQDVRTKIDQNAQQDAMNTILNADSKATNLRTQAFYETQGAADSIKAGKLGAAKSALSAFGGAANSSGWKTSAGGGSTGSTGSYS